jgi:hypothetical protein
MDDFEITDEMIAELDSDIRAELKEALVREGCKIALAIMDQKGIGN